ncbi:hypothetical protein AB0N09_17060 [Streptomyces erythrochromogenes]|uniref:hypothetical protein n=1 Tax=Streptomyces erythrochromogenes TaxID=285574 RepID=UPI003438CF7B
MAKCADCHPKTRSTRPRSCPHCYAWVVGKNRYCIACSGWTYRFPPGTCLTCGAEFFLRDGRCRACWVQARLLEGTELANPDVRIDPRAYFPLITRTGHQLELGGLKRSSQLAYPKWRYRQDRLTVAGEALVVGPCPGEQLRLFEARRDYRCFEKARHADYANLTLVAARVVAERLAELRGWTTEVCRLTDRGLVVVLSGHQVGELISYLDMLPLAADRKVNVERVAEVLDDMGILVDDRPDSFECWLAARSQDLAPEIAEDVRDWLRSLHEGGPRHRSHSRSSTWGKMSAVHPLLLEWSGRHRHLREITRDDIQAAVDAIHGVERKALLNGLRSLFRFMRRRRQIFRDPTMGIKGGKLERPPIIPLPRQSYTDAVAAAITPAQRLMLALAAVHAAPRPGIKLLTLDDLDFSNRKITLAGHTRPLDDLTHDLLINYLFFRHRTWPRTANRHLFLTRVTAHETGPVSDYWCHAQFAGLSASLEQMRIDRHLEEALAGGGDPARLAAVFGISEFTAIRYAEAARMLLEGPLETASRPEPGP